MSEALNDARISALRQQRNRANDDLVEAQAQVDLLRLAIVGVTEQRDGMAVALQKMQQEYDQLKQQNESLATRLEDALKKLDAQASAPEAKPSKKR